MDNYLTVKELRNYFNLSQNIIYDRLQKIREEEPEMISKGDHNKYLLKEDALIHFDSLAKDNLISFNDELLTFILCNKIRKSMKKDRDIIIKLTKRTSIKQKRNLTEFETLPSIIQDKYNDFSKNFVNWLKKSFFNGSLTKVVIDRSPDRLKNKVDTFDLRITLYEGKSPYDLNFIFKREINNLKELKLNKKDEKISPINKIERKIINTFNNSDNFIEDLAKTLKEKNNELNIKKIFKFIIGPNSHYKVIARPDIIIINFDKIELPDKLEISSFDNSLELQFNNGCNFICKLIKEKNSKKLLINFKELPNDLELISL
ncbi:hypothetical protein [Halonatronum saccharophilum]|uniref:hypothetical protein n=1 Tax=Halonatronum saccharophilum TaxID=150060 RepID=UPI00047FA6D4|nr:hypothetical protein [Halonatronum saccharophilum]